MPVSYKLRLMSLSVIRGFLLAVLAVESKILVHGELAKAGIGGGKDGEANDNS